MTRERSGLEVTVMARQRLGGHGTIGRRLGSTAPCTQATAYWAEATVVAPYAKIWPALELVHGGELFGQIVWAGHRKAGIERHYVRRFVSAMGFGYAHGMFHHDFKPEHCLLDDTGNLKVVGFGFNALADYAQDDELRHTLCGMPGYVAPELFRNEGGDGVTTDVWFCGVVIYVLLASALPFPCLATAAAPVAAALMHASAATFSVRAVAPWPEALTRSAWAS
jgi:serine/threonine protein kinase